MTQLIAWSHSRVKTFLDCRKQFYEVNIAKSVPYEQGPEQKEGERVHKALELRLTRKVPLLPGDAKYERLIRAIESLPGLTSGERDIALNRDKRPVGYYDKDVWVRATIDVINVNGKRGALFDYKNGKVTIDEDQLKLYAVMGFALFPDVDVFETYYVWLKHGFSSKKVYHRSDIPQLWADLERVPAAIQIASDRNEWPADPGRKCGYCSVNKAGKCADAEGAYRGS